MTTKPRSVRAIELLRQLIQHTEPGGVFALQTEAQTDIIDVRETFLAEVIGVVTGPEADVGRTPPELMNEVAALVLRTLRDDLLKLIDSRLVRSERDPAFHRIVGMGSLIDMSLHNLGIPESLWTKRPTDEEVGALRAKGAGCNCETCRAKRAGKKT